MRGGSVGIVRSQTEATEFILFIRFRYNTKEIVSYNGEHQIDSLPFLVLQLKRKTTDAVPCMLASGVRRTRLSFPLSSTLR
jgi:hypothetical protein